MFWNIKEPLSYNALLNMIIGERGTGKTHGGKRWAIDDFIKNQNQFIWTRRYDSEFDDFKTHGGKDAFFSDLRTHYPETEFEYKHYNFYVNKEVAGFALPLSLSAKKKSSSYPNVNKLLFDEFIIDKGRSNYLNKEVEIFLDLLETVFRMREKWSAFLMANAITFTNPYFLYFDVKKPTNKKGISRVGDVLVQFVNNPEYREAKNKTRFGQLIKGTNYGAYAIENEFLRDNNDFIIEQPKDLKYFFTIKASGEMYGVWISHGEGLMYVSRKVDPSYRLIFTTILDNHKPNTMLLKGNSSVIFSTFVKGFKMGNVYFDSIKTKNIVLDTIRNTL